MFELLIHLNIILSITISSWRDRTKAWMDLGPTCAQILQRHCTLVTYIEAYDRLFVIIIVCLF